LQICGNPPDTNDQGGKAVIPYSKKLEDRETGEDLGGDYPDDDDDDAYVPAAVASLSLGLEAVSAASSFVARESLEPVTARFPISAQETLKPLSTQFSTVGIEPCSSQSAGAVPDWRTGMHSNFFTLQHAAGAASSSVMALQSLHPLPSHGIPNPRQLDTGSVSSAIVAVVGSVLGDNLVPGVVTASPVEDGEIPPGGVRPSLQDGEQEGATLFSSSHTLLVFTCGDRCSPVILRRSHKEGKIIGKTGYLVEERKLMHYEWTTGPKKGQIVDPYVAQGICQTRNYKRVGHRLVPVWSSPYFKEQDPGIYNREIQSYLKLTLLDEYGSFLQRPLEEEC
jgi:hypothetical protein